MPQEPAPQHDAQPTVAMPHRHRAPGARPHAGAVVTADGHESADSQPQVTDPVGLLRIASMVKKVDDQLDHMDLDEAAAERLDGIAHEVRADLAEAVSGELLDEYDRLVGRTHARRSVAETALVHAQLTGWLDGVMQGLQLQAASAQVDRAQQLVEASMRRQDPQRPTAETPHRKDNSYL